MELVRGHNHTELGRRGNCPGCKDGIPDQINPDAPEGCTYTFVETSIDGLWVCNRHGLVAPFDIEIDENSTTPCIAIKDEPFSWEPFIEEWKRQWTERGESLAPWQEWFVKHIHCGGTFKMVYGRKGPKMICTCMGGDNDADSHA